VEIALSNSKFGIYSFGNIIMTRHCKCHLYSMDTLHSIYLLITVIQRSACFSTIMSISFRYSLSYILTTVFQQVSTASWQLVSSTSSQLGQQLSSYQLQHTHPIFHADQLKPSATSVKNTEPLQSHARCLVPTTVDSVTNLKVLEALYVLSK